MKVIPDTVVVQKLASINGVPSTMEFIGSDVFFSAWAGRFFNSAWNFRAKSARDKSPEPFEERSAAIVMSVVLDKT